MRWYYAVGSEKAGPVTELEIEALVRNGTITPNTYVWNELVGKWVLYGDLKAGRTDGGAAPRQAAAPAAAGQSVCAECGGVFPVDDMVRYDRQTVCAACKPAFFQKVKEGAILPNSLVYAGFWTRFGAKFIDGIVLYMINTVTSMALTGGLVSPQVGQNPAAFLGRVMAVTGLQMAVALAYSVFFVGKFEATPGKMAVGIKIVTPDGGRVGYGRAFGRHFAEFLSSIILGIGYLMAAFDQEKRALHDRICATRVVKK